MFQVVMNVLFAMGDCTFLDRPIFIWGAPRSGTTLLFELIAKHPDVAYLGADEGKPREGTGFWWRAFGEHRGEMSNDLAHPDGIQQIWNAYASLLRVQGKSRLLDKIPFMTLWIQLVNEVFPKARHFHIIRDGRAVVNSILYKLRFSGKEKDQPFCKEELLYGPHPAKLMEPMLQSPAERHAKQWMLLVKQGRKNASILGRRYFELRYEDLVHDPPVAMKSIFHHAQLPYDQTFIDDHYAKTLENRNYKWESNKCDIASDGFTAHRAVEPEDIPSLREMNPLLRLLGYETL